MQVPKGATMVQRFTFVSVVDCIFIFPIFVTFFCRQQMEKFDVNANEVPWLQFCFPIDNKTN